MTREFERAFACDGELDMDDGRKLAYSVHGPGPGDAPATIYMHGSPGSRRGPMLRPFRLHTLGVSVVTFDRPGYGGSTRNEGRRLGDTARDVAQLADHLGIERFGVMGRSGGVAHALGCAALLGERVSSVVGLVGAAPHDVAVGYSGMTSQNVALHESARAGGKEMREQYERLGKEVARDPYYFIRTFLWPQMTEEDRAVFEQNPHLFYMHADAFYEAMVSQQAAGWIDDTLAINQPAGFDLADVHQPVVLWHGERDQFSPVANTLRIAETIRSGGNDRVKTVIAPGEAHFGALTFMERGLAWQRDSGSGADSQT